MTPSNPTVMCTNLLRTLGPGKERTPLIFDPHMTVIRTAPEGRDIYFDTIRRITSRAESPPVPVVHFAGSTRDEYVVSTVFSDRQSMHQMFTGYTLPETEHQMRESGIHVDIAREQGELEHLRVADSVPQSNFGLVEADSLVACTSNLVVPSLDAYWQVIRDGGWFKGEMPGLVAHVAYKHADGVHATDIWTSREAGLEWYRDHLVEQFNRLGPERLDERVLSAAWCELDTFLVTAKPASPARFFVRREEDRIPAINAA